jgi:hypothetical protein
MQCVVYDISSNVNRVFVMFSLGNINQYTPNIMRISFVVAS